MNGFLHIFYMAFASFFTLNHSVFGGVPGFLQRTANDFLFRKPIVALLTGGRGNKKDRRTAVFSICQERGWPDGDPGNNWKHVRRKTLRTMEKVYRKSSNGSISNFNVFFCFNIILTFATWFLRYFSAALRLNICKAQVFSMFSGANIFTFVLRNFYPLY